MAAGLSTGKTGLGVYPDGMVEPDGHAGQWLDSYNLVPYFKDEVEEAPRRQRSGAFSLSNAMEKIQGGSFNS